MYHLRLIKALSYSGVVEATKQHPDVFVKDQATADAAVATGYFQLVGAGLESDDEEDNGEMQPNGEKDNGPELGGREEQPNGKKLEDMTVTELESFAAYKGVSLKGVTKKVDIISKLKGELGDEELDGEVEYGSPTMQDLMEQ